MRNTETVLGIIRARGVQGLPLDDVYRQLYNPALYLRAYHRIARNKGALTPGTTPETVDGMSLAKIEAIIDALRHERYRWTPVRRVYIAKKHSAKKRPLGVPVWSDKLLQEVIRSILEAYYEPQFSRLSHGFRPDRGCHTALAEVQKWQGTVWFIEGDISQCFDSLPHEGVVAAVRRRISDPWILRLIRWWLKAGILEEGAIRSAVAGTPQGGVISPLLANAYLHALDVAWEDKARGAKLIRYCDDYVILCRGNPQPWFQRMEKIVHGLGLSLNAEKTRIVDAVDGFDFLGMHFRLKPMRSNPKRLYCYRWPSTKAMQSVRQKVRDAIGYDDLYSLDDKIRALNPILRGWGQYFHIGNAHRHFKKVDSYVYTKLVNFLRRKRKRRGKGFREFPPSFFQRGGLYQLHGTIVRVFRMPPGERCRKAG